MRGLERSETAPCRTAHFRNIARGHRGPSDYAACRTFGAIPYESSPSEPRYRIRRHVGRRRPFADQIGYQSARRRGLRETEMAVTAGVQDISLAGRASDDGQAIGGRRTMAHPTDAAFRTQARQIKPRERQQHLGTSKIRRRLEAREFSGAANAKPGRQRRRNELALREDDFPRERDAGRRERRVVAPFGLDERPIADPLRQSRRPGASRHHARLEGGAPPARGHNVRPVEVDRLADDDRSPSAARPIPQGGYDPPGIGDV